MMNIVIAGGTGFVGSALCKTLTVRGDGVTVMTRRPAGKPDGGNLRYVRWDQENWQEAVSGADAVINLAGEPIVGRRWSQRQKVRLWDSRVGTTHQLIQAMARSPKKAGVLINASAIGYYGPSGDQALTEEGAPGEGFLSDLCRAWETEAKRAEALGTRVVCIRIGLVLGKEGGALAKMLPPFRLGLGGPMGSGRQWVSWVDRNDLIGILLFALDHSKISGPVNATAPEPVRMREFASTLGKVLNRPAFIPAPGFVLQAVLGEMAAVLLDGQKVLPQAAQRHGYQFMQPSLKQSLTRILSKD